MAFAPQPTPDPTTKSSQWNTFQLGGVTSPGSIPKGGVRGFKRETGWDVKKGKGTQGATLTLKSQPPCEGTFTLQLIAGVGAGGGPSTDFADWDTFATKVLAISPTSQQAKGLSVMYPGLASIGLTTVVVKHYDPPKHQGRGLYIAVVELIEWFPPPATSLVSTVGTKKPDVPDSQILPPDPVSQANQAEIARLRAAGATLF